MDLFECNYDDPKAVVMTFVCAMNAWELSAARLPKVEGITPWASIRQELDAIFAHFCTQKDRPYGRQGSFQSPPEYDPAREKILGVKIESKKAFVDSQREADLGGGEYRYVLHQSAGRWLIDNLKFKESDGSYSKAIL